MIIRAVGTDYMVLEPSDLGELVWLGNICSLPQGSLEGLCKVSVTFIWSPLDNVNLLRKLRIEATRTDNDQPDLPF